MKAFVLLDLIGAADIKIDRDGNSNTELQNMFLRAAQQMGEEDRLYRYDSGSGFTDDHIPFRDYGVTSALLIDLVYRSPGQLTADGTEYSQWWHTPGDTIDMMSAAAMTFAGNLVWNALPMIEEEFFE